MYELFVTALDLGLINRRGAVYTFNGQKAMGKEGFVNLIKSDEGLHKEINSVVRSSK